jgi:hypothetical protein
MMVSTIVFAFVFAGCALSRNARLRPATDSQMVAETSIDKLQTPKEQEVVEKASIERHPNFTLGVIEFSDQGLLWDSDQRDAVLKELENAAGLKGAVIVTFVHGWKHNASVCDDNVACFRAVLQRLAEREETIAPIGKQRAIFGIYLGWRGLSSCNEPGKEVSIWSRKRVDEQLGASQGREVVRSILREYAAIKTQHRDSRLVVAGHSLGAGVVYSAFGPLVQQALTDAIDHRNGTELAPIIKAGDVPLPDLIVLANPAFEAEIYKRTARDLDTIEQMGVHFSKQQLPLMLTVSSEADWATHLLFPAAQTIHYLLAPFDWTRGGGFLWRSLFTSANYGPDVTDRLDVVSTAVPLKKREGATPKERNCFRGDWAELFGNGCACDELSAPGAKARVLQSMTTPCTISKDHQVRTCGDVQMTHLRPKLDYRNPFIVAAAAKEVIGGHNDIYNERFVTFISALINEVDTELRRR